MIKIGNWKNKDIIITNKETSDTIILQTNNSGLCITDTQNFSNGYSNNDKLEIRYGGQMKETNINSNLIGEAIKLTKKDFSKVKYDISI